MKHLKLFEEMTVPDDGDFPVHAHDLSTRERKILTDLVGEQYLNKFTIKVEDHYYYSTHEDIYTYYNIFDNFGELRDYLLSRYYCAHNKAEEYMELLKTSKLDKTFDYNFPIRCWANKLGTYHPIIKTETKKVIKLLLNDGKVRSKLSEDDLDEYSDILNKII